MTPEPEEFRLYREQVELLASQWLTPYVESLDGRERPRSKEFNDPVWKTVILLPLEVVILDSPLIQRLRWIRQLGVAEFVFPGASHTRFQHSIGTLYMVDMLVSGMQLAPGSERLDDILRRVLRLTALCHDVGHGVMSHVSDNAFLLSDDAIDVRLAFQRWQSLEAPPQLSELAAYCLVGSPAFRRLLTKAQDISDDHISAAHGDVCDLMRNAIVGLPISTVIPQLHELISGPFDADKLDYMTRDAQMAGVPVVTDIPRLVRKVRAVSVGEEQIPDELAPRVRAGEGPYLVLGIAHSGGRTLDELMLGRVLLFDKIYRHQRVRAIEAMVSYVLVKLASVNGMHPAVTPLLLSDEQLLDLKIGDIERIAGRDLTADERGELQLAIAFGKQIKERELLARCYAFSTRMPLDPFAEDEDQRGGLLQIQAQGANAEARGRLARRIAAEVEAIHLALGRKVPEPFAAELNSYIWFDPPEASRQGNVFARAFLITGDGRFVRFGDESAESPSWADAYLQAKDVGFVFGPRPLQDVIYLATEKVARLEFGVRTPESMADYIKYDRNGTDSLRRQLADRGYYADSPSDLRPLPERLRQVDAKRTLRSASERLSGYLGPVRGDATVRVVPARVESWVRQFENDDLVDAALRVVASIRVIGRPEVVASLATFAGANREFAPGSICPFGSPKDSSYIATYFAQDVAEPLGFVGRDLSRALGREEPIVFVDDFIGSGGQSIDILEAWLGVERTGDLDEERDVLNEYEQARLLSKSIAFVFAAGTRAGEDALTNRCRELGLNARIFVRIKDDELPRAFETVEYRDDAQKQAFEIACREIGLRLMIASGQSPERAEVRAIGYGNRAFLVAFPYNTPTQTLTALWATGADGLDWLALLPRRKKT